MKLTEYKSVKSELVKFNKMSGFFANLIINSDPIAQDVSDKIYILKRMIINIDKDRKKITVPIDLAKKAVMQQLREATDPIKEAIDLMDGKLTTYHIERREQEEEEQRMLRAIEAKRLQEERDELLEQAEINESQLAIDDAIVKQQEINIVKNIEIKGSGVVKETTGLSTSYLVDHYVYKVEDMSKVHPIFLMVNDSSIKKAINGKDRIKEIPGLTIWNEPRRTTRGR